MFRQKNITKSILVSGPPEATKSFIFEAAIHWAEKGYRGVYITRYPLESLPATYHDRKRLSPRDFRLMRFMYIPTYEDLVEFLVDLHTLAALPSVLLIDDLDAYICDPVAQDQLLDVHVARLCAFIHDSANACSRVLKAPMHLCVSMSVDKIAEAPCAAMYFDNHWNLTVVDSHDENNRWIELCQRSRNFTTTVCIGERTTDDDDDDVARNVFRFRNFTDGALVLKRIYEKLLVTSS